MEKSFNATREGLPYFGTLLGIGIGLVILYIFLHGIPVWIRYGILTASILFLLLGFFSLFFFRDPHRESNAEENAVLSPADGKIVGIETLTSSPHYDGPCIRISIFLSIFNVHVNRMPWGGCIRDIRYKKGQFKNAMKSETSECNEANDIWIDTSAGLMVVRQISGMIARRIVCVVKPGDTLSRGEKVGMIRFGSRTELYLPPGTDINIKMGQKVKAGLTIVAHISSGKNN